MHTIMHTISTFRSWSSGWLRSRSSDTNYFFAAVIERRFILDGFGFGMIQAIKDIDAAAARTIIRRRTRFTVVVVVVGTTTSTNRRRIGRKGKFRRKFVLQCLEFPFSFVHLQHGSFVHGQTTSCRRDDTFTDTTSTDFGRRRRSRRRLYGLWLALGSYGRFVFVVAALVVVVAG